MKRIVFVLIILCQSISIAQNESALQIYESPTYRDRVKIDSVSAIYTADSGRTGLVREDKKSIVLDLFDEDLKFVRFTSMPTDRKENYIGDVFYANEIKVFTESFPEKDVKALSCYIFGLNDNSERKVTLSSTKIDKRLSLYSNVKGAKFSTSPNLKYFSITTYTIHRDEIFYHVSVFDSDSFELIYDKQESRNENKYYSLTETQIDNEKNVFVLGESFYDAESPKLKNEINRHFLIEKFNQNNYSAIDLKLEDKYIKSLKSVVNQNQLNLYGFYSDTGKDRIKGVCNVLIDMQGFYILEKNLQNLPTEIYADLFGKDKADKKKDKELSDYKIDYILSDHQQNVYLLAEEFYLTENYITSYVITPANKHFDNIVIIKFTPDGKLDWGRSIYKSDYKTSYNAFLKNEDLHVVLNSGKNLKELKDGRTKISKGFFETSALYDIVYKSNGNEFLNKIQDNKGKTYYLPNYGTFVGDRFVMMNDSRMERRFMTLE